MKQQLEIGTLASGAKFTLPLDAATHTFAFIGIRGAGKTVAATVMAEEMCEAGLPWIALDPIGVWWGLRANVDGTPGGYPVVIIGGEHADIQLEKDAGAKLADTILQENIACVIDLSRESKNTWRKFVADFCDRMMELRPESPRHVFLEEAPEFIPQRPMGEQKRSLAAVDRITRLGRNNGYGMSIISQRYATVQKDVLTQCETLFAGRMIGKPDRDTCHDWMVEAAGISDKEAARFLESMPHLENGQFWFWSPQWLKTFVQVRIRRRKTFHPGETRVVGQAQKQVALSNVAEFVERFQKTLKRTERSPSIKTVTSSQTMAWQPSAPDPRDIELSRLRDDNRKLAEVVDSLRKRFEPEYRQLQALFGDLEKAGTNGTHVNAGVFEPWKEKLGKGPARLIDLLLDRGELTRVQLKTLAGYSGRSMTNHISSLNSNQLIEKDGDKIRLRQP